MKKIIIKNNYLKIQNIYNIINNELFINISSFFNFFLLFIKIANKESKLKLYK